MGNPSFRLASIAAGVALTLLAGTSQAQVTGLDDRTFDLALGVEWFTGGTAASIGTLGTNHFVALDAAEYVYQSFTVAAGGSYTVSFDAFGTGLAELFNSTTSGAPNYSSYAGVLGSAPGTWGTPPTPGWQNVSFTFVANPLASYHLYFSGLGAQGLLVDNVAVTMAAPVPEPESFAMMFAGLGALGFMARRRKQSQA
jgi:PEP-CTERM motif